MSTALSDAGVQFANGDTQAYPAVPVRQTVLSGAVDSNGFSSFGGSTGSTTVTAATTLVATAANGVTNRTGSIVNPSWTGLSTNGTMYLGLTVNADGTCTPFVTTLAPTYQWGGTFSTTANQRTFNIQQMQMQNGNGSTAAQSYDVFVGEVTVAGGVTTAIVWYQLMGRYDSGFTATLPAVNTLTSKSHNIGIKPDITSFIFECTTADVGINVGEQIDYRDTLGADGANFARQRMIKTSLSMAMRTPAGASSFAALNASGVMVTLTAASYKWKMIAQRSW
jgi:hypothetical protein